MEQISKKKKITILGIGLWELLSYFILYSIAGKSFFDTDNDFKINNFFDFCTRYLKKEPKEKGQAPAMIVFCAFEQMQMWFIRYFKYSTISPFLLSPSIYQLGLLA